MKKVINIFIAALLIASMVIHAENIINGTNSIPSIILDVIAIISSILIMYYNFYGYKKPHGNLLRYIFFIFGFTLIVGIFLLGAVTLTTLIRIVAGTIIVYMSGRLNKIEKNKTLTIVVIILFAAAIVMNVFQIDIFFGAAQNVATEIPQADASNMPKMSVHSFLRTCTSLFPWIALSLAYTSRYGAHKEAGLEDKPKA